MSPKIPLTLSFAKAANFLGVVGIIGSLIFVGLELRQNQKLAKTNAYQTRLSEMQQAMLNLALSNDLAAIRVKRKLEGANALTCLLYTSPSPRDQRGSRMPSSA